eukprot:1140640-Pelagomonas_calceolata.AAC.3
MIYSAAKAASWRFNNKLSASRGPTTSEKGTETNIKNLKVTLKRPLPILPSLVTAFDYPRKCTLDKKRTNKLAQCTDSLLLA